MNWSEIPPGGGDGGDRQPGKRGVHLQGPRPSPLSVNKASHKIGKPPRPAPPYHPQRAPPPANREPVIIYAISPKVIHTEASDFMSVVQRLTGLCSSSTGASSSEIAAGGPISPAARMAVLERASPPDRERERERATAIDESELLGMMDWDTGAVDLGLIPGILSPAPANLPAVTAEMFSPASDPQSLFGIQDNFLSPWAYGNFFPSPSSSALFPGGTIFSPAPSPVFDISKLFDY